MDPTQVPRPSRSISTDLPSGPAGAPSIPVSEDMGPSEYFLRTGRRPSAEVLGVEAWLEDPTFRPFLEELDAHLASDVEDRGWLSTVRASKHLLYEAMGGIDGFQFLPPVKKVELVGLRLAEMRTKRKVEAALARKRG